MKTLSELKNENLPRLNWEQIFKVNGDQFDEKESNALHQYFQQFVEPGKCLMCGAQQGGNMIDQFVGKARFTWGLANGEGFCSNCHYPARAYHRNVGPIEFLNMVLQYHPNELQDKTAACPQTEASTTAETLEKDSGLQETESQTEMPRIEATP